jgi:phosphate butyryltransferase
MVLDVKKHNKLLMLTDGAMNITPTVEQRKEIIRNSVEVAEKLGIEDIKVAALSSVEKVNPKMPSSVEGRELQDQINSTDEINCHVEGPLALDLAVSKHSAESKGYKGKIQGDADILVAPNIDVANAVYKTVVYLSESKTAGVIVGAAAPIILTSRADSAESKLYSIALATYIS